MTVILIFCNLFFLIDSTDEHEVCSLPNSCGSQTISSAAPQPSYSCDNIISSCGVYFEGDTSISPSAQSDLHEVIDFSTLQTDNNPCHIYSSLNPMVSIWLAQEYKLVRFLFLEAVRFLFMEGIITTVTVLLSFFPNL